MSARGRARRGGPGAPLAAAVALAVLAVAMLLASADPRVLRLAVVTTLWAFLLVALVATRRHGGRTATGELELRRLYEVELAREVAARREHELRVELQVRRDLEGALRVEVDALRRDLAALHQRIVDSLDGAGAPADPARTTLRTASTRLPGGGLRELAGNLGALVTEEQDLPVDVAEVPAGTRAPRSPAGVVVRWLPEAPGAPHATAVPGLTRPVPEPAPRPPAVAAVRSSGGRRPRPWPDPPARPGGDTGVVTSGFHTGVVYRDQGRDSAHNRPGHDTYGHKQQVPGLGIGRLSRDTGAARRNAQTNTGHGTVRCGTTTGVAEGDSMDGDTGDIPRTGAADGTPDEDGTGRAYGVSTSPGGGRAGGPAPAANRPAPRRDAEDAPPGRRGVGRADVSGSGRDGEVSGEIVEPRRVEDGTGSEPAVVPRPTGEQHTGEAGAEGEAAHGRHYRGDDDTGTFVRMLGGKLNTAERPRHRRYREDDEENEVLTRVLGR